MYSFTNQFSGPTLRQRVGMMNSQRSGSLSLWRYGVWLLLLGTMALACRHRQTDSERTAFKQPNSLFPLISPTRARVADLESKGTWYRHLALFRTKFGSESIQIKPIILQLKGNQFLLSDEHVYESAVYIDGKEVPAKTLETLSPEFVSEVFVMHQWENMANTDTQAKPYQVLIQTSPKPVRFTGKRKQFFTLLQAAAVSKYPLGESFSFTMNQLLEATFFHNKNALVERTKNEHLRIYDDYAGAVEVSINNLPATPDEVKTIHVREVARLYTKERPYLEWFRADNPMPRFELHILTAPKRAKRDSSYYVFSPFYTGDF